MFRFKQFAIRQENSAMKVGTDGALLGAWSNCNSAKNCLDIGAGTGIITMMLAQRNSEAHITGIEVDENSCKDTSFNIANCPWSNRISILNEALQKYQPQKKYDCIVSNPPFFENSLKSNDSSKTAARHTDSLHYSDILLFAQQYLSTSGILSLILPVDNANTCIAKAVEFDLYLTRKCHVKPTPTKVHHRMLFELSKKKPLDIQEEEIIIETGKRHEYHASYVALTKEFYIIM